MGTLQTRGLRDQRGFMLVELLIVTALLVLVLMMTFTALDTQSRVETRDQAYAQEITGTQAALARLIRDLREATAFQQITPTAIQFQMVEAGSTYDVRYDCGAADTLGSAYTRCARTSAVAPASPPAYGSRAGPLDIQHVANGRSSTFCNTTGSAQAGVFFVSNPAEPNTDGSTLACDEGYETIIATQLLDPTYVQVLVRVPASGDLKSGGMNHKTVLESGAFIANLEIGG